MSWLGAYTASNKCPVLEKGPLIRDYILCVHILGSAEDLGFLDTSVHIHVHVVTHARIQDYNDGTHCECMINYGYALKECRSREIFQ